MSNIIMDFIILNKKWVMLLFTLLVVVVTIYNWRRRWLYYHAYKIPGPFALPLLGSVHLVKDGPHGVYNFVMNLYKKYPKTLKFWMGPSLYVSTTEPEHLRIILTRFLDKGNFYRMMSEYFGRALAASPVEAWKTNRKNVNPTFNISLINSFMDPFTKHARTLADTLGKNCGKETDDILPIVWRHTLDAACETLSDVNPNLVGCENFLPGCFRIEEILLRRFFTPFLHLNIFWKFSAARREIISLWKQNCDFIQQIINNMMISQSEKSPPDSQKRFLNHLLHLEEKNGTPHQYVLEEGQIMYFVGTETSATALSTTLVVLGMYPEVQDKIDEELSSIFGNSDRSPTLEDVNNMEYLERVLKETMRLLPPIPFIMRTLDEDVHLDSYVFPAGANVVIPIPVVHRRADFWPDPLKFDPDRFLPEEVERRPPCSYIPFSYGLRNCIGSKYAMLSMKVMLSTIMRRYRVKSSNYKKIEDMDILITVVARVKKGYKIVLEEKKC